MLVFGLGLLGGGVAATNWLLKHGARVTVTDLKTRKELASSVRKIRGRVALKLGGHRKEDIKHSDVVVANPDVSIKNPFIRYALRLGKRVENEATIFFESFPGKMVGVTGTRGKTTTTAWANHFLKAGFRSAIAGNSTEHQFLKVLNRADKLDRAVAEVPSFHLELFDDVRRTSDVTVITNIYQDHLNRHGTLRQYALTKAKLFERQTPDQHLVLNADDDWTRFFLRQRPRAQVWFFSARSLPRGTQGVFYRSKAVYFQFDGRKEKVFELGDFIRERGEHNLYNLLASSLAAYLAGASWFQIQRRIASLPAVPFRQQVIFKGKRLIIVNDTAATSPEGCIAAVKRFGGPHTILIAGGTDRDLDFSQWGKVIPRCIKRENIVLLSGSATDKMLATLGRRPNVKVFDTLAETLRAALELAEARRHAKTLVVFSSGAKSFEKFRNEYDRGKKFNALVAKEVGR